MRLNQIQARVHEVRQLARTDSELAHIEEDALYIDFIKHVATLTRLEGGELAEKANAVLATKAIQFRRNCA